MNRVAICFDQFLNVATDLLDVRVFCSVSDDLSRALYNRHTEDHLLVVLEI
jgi:hypothetical protein